MKKRMTVLAGIFLLGLCVSAQNGEKTIKAGLADYFSAYRTSYTTASDRCRIESVEVNSRERTAKIHMNELFCRSVIQQGKGRPHIPRRKAPTSESL